MSVSLCNLHMLLYAASMDGQGAVAVQAGKDYAKRTNDSMYHALTLIRFGRFDEVVEVTKRPEREVNAAAWDFARGYAKLKLKEPDFAQVYLDRMKKTAETSKGVSKPSCRALAGRADRNPRRRDRAHGRRFAEGDCPLRRRREV
ncbi:MAG: hypothetical protein ACRD2N_11235 [Vicinamibacterales bacterium]